MEGDKIRKVKTALNSWWMEKQLKIFSTAASIACKAAQKYFLSSQYLPSSLFPKCTSKMPAAG